MVIKDLLKKPATWVTGLVGLLLIIIKVLAGRNDSLKAKDKLAETSKENAILNTKRDQVKEDIRKEQESQSHLKDQSKEAAKGASEQEIKDFYKKRT